MTWLSRIMCRYRQWRRGVLPPPGSPSESAEGLKQPHDVEIMIRVTFRPDGRPATVFGLSTEAITPMNLGRAFGCATHILRKMTHDASESLGTVSWVKRAAFRAGFAEGVVPKGQQREFSRFTSEDVKQ